MVTTGLPGLPPLTVVAGGCLRRLGWRGSGTWLLLASLPCVPTGTLGKQRRWCQEGAGWGGQQQVQWPQGGRGPTSHACSGTHREGGSCDRHTAQGDTGSPWEAQTASSWTTSQAEFPSPELSAQAREEQETSTPRGIQGHSRRAAEGCVSHRTLRPAGGGDSGVSAFKWLAAAGRSGATGRGRSPGPPR